MGLSKSKRRKNAPCRFFRVKKLYLFIVRRMRMIFIIFGRNLFVISGDMVTSNNSFAR